MGGFNSKPSRAAGPLAGLRVVEFAGLAPVPFAGMILADFGADVIRIDRPGQVNVDTLSRGKRSIEINLKSPEAAGLVLKLLEKADVLLDPFRPGVLERIGLGPEVVMAHNPKLIYARLTGFGQTGPLAKKAGHDLNYVALTGTLSQMKRPGEKPLPPLNLLGDFAGGSMFCVMGVLMALLERQRSRKGQVLDVAMIDGAVYLASFVYGMKSLGLWNKPPGMNLLDSGAHFYDVYETKDGRYLAVAAIEPQFYAQFLDGLDLTPEEEEILSDQMTESNWPRAKQLLSSIFQRKTLQEWLTIYEDADACVTPVLKMEELDENPHTAFRKLVYRPAARASGEENAEAWEPSPAPRFSRTPAVTSEESRPRPNQGQHTQEVLIRELGLSPSEVKRLSESGTIPELRSRL